MKTNNLPSPVAFLNSDINDRNNNGPYADLLKSGYANGYVALPPGHPLHGKNLMDSFIDVHGGITFNDYYSRVKEQFTKIDFIDDSSNLTENGGWLALILATALTRLNVSRKKP